MTLIRTICGSEFQREGAENRKACLEKSSLWISSGMEDDESTLGDIASGNQKQHILACLTVQM